MRTETQLLQSESVSEFQKHQLLKTKAPHGASQHGTDFENLPPRNAFVLLTASLMSPHQKINLI